MSIILFAQVIFCCRTFGHRWHPSLSSDYLCRNGGAYTQQGVEGVRPVL